MKKTYEAAVVVELGTANELVLGPFGGAQDWPEDGGQGGFADNDE